MKRLLAKRTKPSEFTTGLIKEKFKLEESDTEIATTVLHVSLACPLGKIRMTNPCRASTCSHLQCFDALTFLHMNEKKSTWKCPVCDKDALYENLTIDEYFLNVIQSSDLGSDENEIQLMKDGSWSRYVVNNNIQAKVERTTTPSIEISDEGNFSLIMNFIKITLFHTQKTQLVQKKQKWRKIKNQEVIDSREMQRNTRPPPPANQKINVLNE